MIVRLSTINNILFKVDDCAKNKSFIYYLRNYCIRFGDGEIKALITLRISLDTKILSFGLLVTAIKNGKKFRHSTFRFRIAGLKETIVEINVSQYLRRLIRIDAYYQYYRTTPSHN